MCEAIVKNISPAFPHIKGKATQASKELADIIWGADKFLVVYILAFQREYTFFLSLLAIYITESNLLQNMRTLFTSQKDKQISERLRQKKIKF